MISITISGGSFEKPYTFLPVLLNRKGNQGLRVKSGLKVAVMISRGGTTMVAIVKIMQQ